MHVPRLAAAVALGGLTVALIGGLVQQQGKLGGAVKIDGSSTVYPITEAVAEEFAKIAPAVRVTVGISGTGGGFKRFATGETDISDASRPIKKAEHDEAVAHGVEYVELPVAFDGLSIVVNKANIFVDQLTIDELKKIFLDDAAASTWQDVRAEWPAETIKVYSPGTDSGTFDYFKEVVAGKDKAMRGDMSVSEDDNVLVRGVSGDASAIGFFGCAYYFENKDKLRVIPIVNPKTKTAVTPSHQTIESGEYAPFSRPLLIYVNKKSLARPEVQAFVQFYLLKAAELSEEVGYVKLPKPIYERATANYKAGKTGTQFLDAKGDSRHGPLADLYR